MPDEWKYALIPPLFKGKGSSDNFDNYRAISVLSPFGKIFERLISVRVVNYFDINNLFTSAQHGFRANYSCETAFVSIIDNWKNNLNKGNDNLALFVDFKKAFDHINPKLLFLKLFQYGFDNNALALFEYYFRNRTQSCRLGDFCSNKVDVKIGVPQGSVLWPLLFLISINDLC